MGIANACGAAMLGKNVSEKRWERLRTEKKHFSIWEGLESSPASSCLVSGDLQLSSPSFPSAKGNAKAVSAENDPRPVSIPVGFGHLLRYPCVILPSSSLDMLPMCPPMAIEPSKAIGTLARAVEDAQMRYSVCNSWEQNLFHPPSSESQSQSD